MRALRSAAHSYPRDLLAGRRPNRESESAPGPRAAPARAPNGPRRSRMRRCRCTGAPDIGRAHPGGVAAHGRSPRVIDRSIAQLPPLPSTPSVARELGRSSLGSSTGSTPDDVEHTSRPTSMRARSALGAAMIQLITGPLLHATALRLKPLR